MSQALDDCGFINKVLHLNWKWAKEGAGQCQSRDSTRSRRGKQKYSEEEGQSD